MNLYVVLKPLQERLCKQMAYRYRFNDMLSDFFQYENLISISNEIIIEMSQKGEFIEEAGVYNYFKKSFSYKCQDLYRQLKTKKRNHVSESLTNIDIPIEPKLEIKCERKDLLNNIRLKLRDLENTKKKPYLKIFDFLCLGYTLQEISGFLDISLSMTKRYKSEMIKELSTIYKKNKDNYFIDFDNTEIIIFDPTLTNVPPIKQYFIETNYKVNESFAEIKLIESIDFEFSTVKSYLCKNEQELNRAYLEFKKELSNLKE